MARPIEPTPELDEEDSERLRQSMKKVCSPEEAARRIAWAQAYLAQVSRRKHPTETTPL